MKLEWIQNGLVGALLLLNAWYDWRKREIRIWSLWVFGLLGVGIHVVWQQFFAANILGGAAIGGVMVVISWLSHGAIGAGDGLLLCVTGIYLGFINNLELLLRAFFLCAVFTAVLWICKKVHQKTRIPFVPFLFLSYVYGAVL